jgi:hypothetical protein
MATQLDLEWWILNTTNKVKSCLNTKITAVQDLKSKDDLKFGLSEIELVQLNENAFFYQDIGIEAINYDCFVLFKWGTKLDVTEGGEGIEQASLISTLHIGGSFEPDSEEHARKIFRYRRALKASLMEAYRQYSHQGFKILSLPDGLFELTNQHTWGIPIVAEWYFV